MELAIDSHPVIAQTFGVYLEQGLQYILMCVSVHLFVGNIH